MTDRHTPAGTPRTKRVMAPILSLSHVNKVYTRPGGFKTGQVTALCDVSLELYPGEILGLVGESGSGKSTILKLLARLETPSSGDVRVDGRDILKEEPRGASLAYRGQVQMIFQDPFGSLNPVHTVGHHLSRPLLRHEKCKGRAQARKEALGLLQTVGLSPPEDFIDKFPHQMSGGQRQRVAIARALAVGPKVILADEPTSMLDVSIRMGILNLLDDLKVRKGISYLYVTHDLASARYISDRIVVLYKGLVVETGTTEAIMSAPLHPYTKLLLSAVPDPKRAQLPLVRAPEESSSSSPGCPFAARCSEALTRCRTELPGTVDVEATPGRPERQVRCHLFSE